MSKVQPTNTTTTITYKHVQALRIRNEKRSPPCHSPATRRGPATRSHPKPCLCDGRTKYTSTAILNLLKTPPYYPAFSRSHRTRHQVNRTAKKRDGWAMDDMLPSTTVSIGIFQRRISVDNVSTRAKRWGRPPSDQMRLTKIRINQIR